MRAKYFDPASVKVAVRSGDIWIKMFPWMCLLIIGLLIVLTAGVFWPVIKRNHDLQLTRAILQSRIEDAKSLNLQLQQENHALQSDRVYVERVARDVLNVGRVGEIIFQFPDYRIGHSSKNSFNESVLKNYSFTSQSSGQ